MSEKKLTLGQEIDSLISRAKKAQHRKYEAEHQIDSLLKTIFEAFESVIDTDDLYSRSDYKINDYTIRRVPDVWSLERSSIFFTQNLNLSSKTKGLFGTHKAKKRVMRSFRINKVVWIKTRPEYTIDGNEELIQEFMPYWPELIKDLAMQIALRHETQADKFEGQREAGLHILES